MDLGLSNSKITFHTFGILNVRVFQFISIVFQVLGYIKSGIDEGANLRAGGAKWGDKGFFVQPTVFR